MPLETRRHADILESFAFAVSASATVGTGTVTLASLVTIDPMCNGIIVANNSATGTVYVGHDANMTTANRWIDQLAGGVSRFYPWKCEQGTMPVYLVGNAAGIAVTIAQYT